MSKDNITSLRRRMKYHQGRVGFHEECVRSIEEAMAAVVCPYKKGQRIMVQKEVWTGLRHDGRYKNQVIAEEWFIDYVEYQNWNKPPYEMYGRKIKKNGEPTSLRPRWIRGDVLRVVE